MNMNKPYFTLFQFVCLLLCLISSHNNNNVVHCFSQKKVLSLNHLQWKHSTTTTITPPTYVTQKSSSTRNGVTAMEMKQRVSEKIKTLEHWNKHLKTQLILDDLQVKSLQSRFRNRETRPLVLLSRTRRSDDDDSTSTSTSTSRTQTIIPVMSGLRLQILNYIVTVQLGSSRNMSVIVDTGSDLTWVQCQPCKSCYNQKEPLFNPALSKTYQPVPCNSTTCQSLQFATGFPAACSGPASSCQYDVSYGDGSRTRGDLSRDRLSLGPTQLDGFVFGCGRSNKGLFGGASGLMGLGRSDLSLISQSLDVFGGVFSYCLPSGDGDPDATGSFVMGGGVEASGAYRNSTPIAYTSMVPNPQLPTFYFLGLTGISLGDVDVNSMAATILIDSGTVISRLAPSIYKPLKAEFVKQFSGFAPAPGFSILDTCYNLTGYDEVSVPTMKMRFDGGAELDIDVGGMLYMVKNDASQVCLAFASLSYEYEIGILGNYQQKNQRVVYDTKEARLGFAGETCSFG